MQLLKVCFDIPLSAVMSFLELFSFLVIRNIHLEPFVLISKTALDSDVLIRYSLRSSRNFLRSSRNFGMDEVIFCKPE